MNNNLQQNPGGASIKPSARPSIHNHVGCPLAGEPIMVRYTNDSDDSTSEQGVDEIDHVLSKHANPIELPTRLKNKQKKRNSVCIDQKQNVRDINDVLSKSAPTKLPSQLYYREVEQQRNKQNTSDISYHSLGTPNRSNYNTSSSYSESPGVLETECITPNAKTLSSSRNYKIANRKHKENSFMKIAILILILALVMSVCGYGLQMFNTFCIMSNVNIYDKLKFYNDISGLGQKYNVDEDSILQVQAGISTIFERQDTGSFIFVYNSKASNFNPTEFNQFIDDVSYAAAKFLRNDSAPVHYTTVEGRNLDMDSHGELVTRYQEELARGGVMLVRHVEAVPSDLAMAFHYYCDEYNPLVKKSAIFFTMNLAECPQLSENQSSFALIEKCLAKKWSNVPKDNIGPLLTRVVSVVVDVTSSF